MASADYTFWLGREAEAHRPMRVFVDSRGCMAETVALIRAATMNTVAQLNRAQSRRRLG